MQKNCYARWLCCSDQWFWLMKRNLFCVVTRSPCTIGCRLHWHDRFCWTTSIEVQQPELVTRKNKVNRYDRKLITFWHEVQAQWTGHYHVALLSLATYRKSSTEVKGPFAATWCKTAQRLCPYKTIREPEYDFCEIWHLTVQVPWVCIV